MLIKVEDSRSLLNNECIKLCAFDEDAHRMHNIRQPGWILSEAGHKPKKMEKMSKNKRKIKQSPARSIFAICDTFQVLSFVKYH